MAYVVNMLNGDSFAAEDRSFSGFQYCANKVKSSDSELRKLIEQYAELVAQFAVTYLKDDETGRNTLNSNDFKTPKFYQKWCDHAKDDKDVAKWKESIIAALPMENTDE